VSGKLPGSKGLDGLLITAALLGANAVSYVFTIVAARILTPAVFGELSALLALLVVGVVPAMSLQAAGALRIARAQPGDRRETSALVGLGLAVSAVVLTFALALSPVLVVLLHLDGFWPVLWLAMSLAPLTALGLFHGLLQGARRFGALALLVGMEAVGKIGGGLVGLLVGGTSTWALAGTAVGSAAVALVGWVLCGRPAATRPQRRAGGEVLHAAQAMLALVLLVNLDLVLARHHLPARQAGEYAVGAVITKVAYWLPQAVGVIVLPKLVHAGARRTALPAALAICAALDAVVVLGAALFGPTAVGLIGGSAYAGESMPLWQFALVGSFLALVQLLLFARIASADRRSTTAVWVAVAVEVLLISLWLHDSMTQVVTAASIATGLLVLVGGLIEGRHGQRPTGANGLKQDATSAATAASNAPCTSGP
jgi:O-antigen/teichoic acid export membrane protein